MIRFKLWALAAIVVFAGLGAFAGQASAGPGAYKVLFVYGLKSCESSPPVTMQSQLAAEPGISKVDLWDETTSTPSDATLDQYDMVLAMSDCDGYQDPASLGNNLADYVDQGGVVVEFAWNTEGDVPGYALTGRWGTGGYDPYVPGVDDNSDVTLGTYDASSPLMAGVTSLQSRGNADPTLNVGATRVALWNTGQEAIAYKGDVVAVNAAVGDETGVGYWSGDFARVALNAVTWLGRHNLTVTKGGTGSGTVSSGPVGIACGSSCTAAFNNGTTVTLSAASASGSSFAGWSGAGCSGTGTCTVKMSGAQAVTATFTALPPPPPPSHRQTATFGNQQVTLISPNSAVCQAATGKLAVSLSSKPLSTGKALRFKSAGLYIDKGVKHKRTFKRHGKKVTVITYTANTTARHLPVTEQLSIAGLKSGTHKLTVKLTYKETKTVKVRHGATTHKVKKTITVFKKLTASFLVC